MEESKKDRKPVSGDDLTSFKFLLTNRQKDFLFALASEIDMSAAEYLRRILEAFFVLTHPQYMHLLGFNAEMIKSLEQMMASFFAEYNKVHADEEKWAEFVQAMGEKYEIHFK